MSSDCKIVRGISLFLCFVGVVSVAAAVIMFLYAPSAGLASEDDVLIAQVSAGVLLAVGLLDLVCGVMGARLSKTPAKLKPFVWAACAVCVVNIVTIIRSVAENSLDLVWVNALYAATAFAAIVYASRALKAAGDN
ncbi:MAG TPA: hypothetical protein IAA19_06340 [Candidatus Olsenella pullistercoris]|uniref:Uncharacterized protein n=1 Tax=Candidatus Olsenella pullistercoris TaxID=2838712 RepID=A0A9D2F052_9ACTN|nr:hypothetical protein [Candidatus Olsenella pullistercoris]